MPQISRKVIPYEFNYVCDHCNNGMLMVIGEQNEEGLYPHKCMICSKKTNLKKSYPHIEYFGEDEILEDMK